MRRVLPALIALFLLPATAHAANYSTSPGASLSSAANQLQPGDTLCFHGGTYTFRDYSVWSGMRSGTASAPITLTACAGERPVFDGGMVSGEFWIPSGKSYIRLTGVTLQHFDNASGNGVITPSSGSHHLEIDHDVFTDNGSRLDNDHDVYIGGCSSSCLVHDISIHHNRMQNSPGGALHMWHYQEGYNIFFYDNVVVNHAVGAYVCDDANNVRIYNNTFINNYGRGTIVTSCGQQVNGPGTQGVWVRNNIAVRQSGEQWQRGGEHSGVLHEDHNVWFGGGVSWTMDPTSTRSNPLLDASYRPQSGSPAIDRGTATDAASTDFVDAPRPQGAGFDIGAFETGGGSPPPPPPPSDTTPPTAPTNLVATGPSCADGACTLHVTFTAASDNVAVDHLNLYRPLGALVGTDVGTATSTDFGGSLPRCSTQTMGLEAVDAAGNKSTVAQVTGKTYCPTSLDITNFRRDSRTDTDAGVIWFAWTAPSSPVSKYNEYRDKNGDGVLQSTDLVYSGATSSPDVVGGSLACGTTVLVGLEAVGTDGTVGPRVQAPMTTKAC